MEPRVTSPRVTSPTRIVQPSMATRLAELQNRPTTSSYLASRTLANNATSASHMMASQGDAVQESLEAVLDKMKAATQALVIYVTDKLKP